jgi:hypothetical protein
MEGLMESSVPGDRRYRPLGLSVAILAAALLYGVYPLLPVLLMIWLNLQGRTIGAEIVSWLGWLNAALGLLTLLASALAWVGRPAWSRWALIALVLLATVLRLVQEAQVLFPRSSGIGEVSGSLSGLSQPFAVCQIPLLILVPLYIAWYMNRAPAREFYR